MGVDHCSLSSMWMDSTLCLDSLVFILRVFTFLQESVVFLLLKGIICACFETRTIYHILGNGHAIHVSLSETLVK